MRTKNCRVKAKSSLMIGLTVLAGGVFFYFTAAAAMHVEGIAKNITSMGKLQTRIVEDYRAPSNLMPGSRVKKIVNVKNTGSVDAIVRIRVEKALGALDEEGRFTPETGLNPDWIEIAYDDTGSWVFQEDGYFYYSEILPAGEMSKKPLMTSFLLSPEAKNPCKGKEGRIFLHMESVQAEADAVSLWGKTKEEMGILYDAVIEKEASAVEFRSFEEGFVFHPKSTDLFSSFKYLCPGSERSQQIHVKNLSGKEVFLTLRAAPSRVVNQEKRELVEKILREYAKLRVLLDGKVIYEGSLNGNPEGVRTGEPSMGKGVSLGKFQAGGSRRIHLFLELSPEMDNEYMSLLANVDWIFEAVKEETTPVTTQTPTPGPTRIPQTPIPTRILQTPVPTRTPQTPTPYRTVQTAEPPKTPYPQSPQLTDTAVTPFPARRTDVYPDTGDRTRGKTYLVLMFLGISLAAGVILRKRRDNR